MRTLSMMDWKSLTKCQGWKMQDWKIEDHGYFAPKFNVVSVLYMSH